MLHCIASRHSAILLRRGGLNSIIASLGSRRCSFPLLAWLSVCQWGAKEKGSRGGRCGGSPASPNRTTNTRERSNNHWIALPAACTANRQATELQTKLLTDFELQAGRGRGGYPGRSWGRSRGGAVEAIRGGAGAAVGAARDGATAASIAGTWRPAIMGWCSNPGHGGAALRGGAGQIR